MDKWKRYELVAMLQGGNQKASEYFAKNKVPLDGKIPEKVSGSPCIVSWRFPTPVQHATRCLARPKTADMFHTPTPRSPAARRCSTTRALLQPTSKSSCVPSRMTCAKTPQSTPRRTRRAAGAARG